MFDPYFRPCATCKFRNHSLITRTFVAQRRNYLGCFCFFLTFLFYLFFLSACPNSLFNTVIELMKQNSKQNDKIGKLICFLSSVLNFFLNMKLKS